ncbi:MAG: LuxR C-terminal-related transcriptional regulator, partial [Kiloniellales bacterium]|nr:LuxR C-terminal-related transcriptional regulator [Kiloniellales bacterium]
GISIPIIVVTAYGDVPTAVRAMKRGAVDFIEKPYNDQAMLDRIQLCIERDAKMRREKEIRREVTWRVERLTPREREVFELIVAGRSNKEVARALDISPKTVEAHRAKVMDKMAVGSLAELVQLSTYLELS